MEKRRTKPKQGSILISEPSLRDFYFRQSVILLAEHNEEGTFGVIINKPIEEPLGNLLNNCPFNLIRMFPILHKWITRLTYNKGPALAFGQGLILNYSPTPKDFVFYPSFNPVHSTQPSQFSNKLLAY